MGAVVLSFMAGTFSVLSPCVLPLVPLVAASALQQHRHGPLALGAGLVLSSSATGLGFASLGFALGLDRDVARAAAGAAMAAVGLVLLVPRLQEGLAAVAGPVASRAGELIPRLPGGLGGQLLLGVLLGVVWTPCTGPTLAAAITLASRSEDLARAGLIMLVFSVGAVLPILVLAYGTRSALAASVSTWARARAVAIPALGVVLLAVGVLALSGADRGIEAWMVARMPDWLVDLTVRF